MPMGFNAHRLGAVGCPQPRRIVFFGRGLFVAPAMPTVILRLVVPQRLHAIRAERVILHPALSVPRKQAVETPIEALV